MSEPVGLQEYLRSQLHDFFGLPKGQAYGKGRRGIRPESLPSVASPFASSPLRWFSNTAPEDWDVPADMGDLLGIFHGVPAPETGTKRRPRGQQSKPPARKPPPPRRRRRGGGRPGQGTASNRRVPVVTVDIGEGSETIPSVEELLDDRDLEDVDYDDIYEEEEEEHEEEEEEEEVVIEEEEEDDVDEDLARENMGTVPYHPAPVFRMDIKERPDCYVVKAELAGFEKDDIRVELVDNAFLKIDAEHHRKKKASEPAKGRTEPRGEGKQTGEPKTNLTSSGQSLEQETLSKSPPMFKQSPRPTIQERTSEEGTTEDSSAEKKNISSPTSSSQAQSTMSPSAGQFDKAPLSPSTPANISEASNQGTSARREKDTQLPISQKDLEHHFFLLMERPKGRLARVIRLPKHIDTSVEIHSKFKNGLLVLKFAKQMERQRKQIVIQ